MWEILRSIFFTNISLLCVLSLSHSPKNPEVVLVKKAVIGDFSPPPVFLADQTINEGKLSQESIKTSIVGFKLYSLY